MLIDQSNQPYRLRQHRLLVNNSGDCELIYDLERTFIIKVPSELRASLKKSIEVVNYGSALYHWLEEEDLLTKEIWSGRSDSGIQKPPVVTDISFDMSGSCNMGCLYCFEDAIGSRIGRMSEKTALTALDFVFKKTAEAKRIALHFGSGEPLLRFELLKLIIEEANRRASQLGKIITYDLTTNATMITPEIAKFLQEQPFNVRVSCDGPAHLQNYFRPMVNGASSYELVERGLTLLLNYLPERVTVNSVLCYPTRLAELWQWAKKKGIRRYHVIKVGASDNKNYVMKESELSHFREDLEVICTDMFDELEVGKQPIDYQPITKIVRRLMIPQPITRFCGVAGSYLGVASDGNVYPCFRHLGLNQYRLGHVSQDTDDQKRVAYLKLEATDVDNRPVCNTCWARYLCGGGCYADSVVYGTDKRKPQEEHCSFWRAEIEQAIRFFDCIKQNNPEGLLLLFGDSLDGILTAIDGIPQFTTRTNCS